MKTSKEKCVFILQSFNTHCNLESKKSLKISKAYSESVNQRWTDNTMVKRKRATATKHAHKTKDRVTRNPLRSSYKYGDSSWNRKVFTTSGTSRWFFETHMFHNVWVMKDKLHLSEWFVYYNGSFADYTYISLNFI